MCFSLKLIFITCGSLYVFTCIKALFLRSCDKTMDFVPREKRIFSNVLIWLNLIPYFGIIFQWLMMPYGIPNGLKNVTGNDSTSVSCINTLKKIGMAYTIIETIGFLCTCFNVFLLLHIIHNINPIMPSFSVLGALKILLDGLGFVLWLIYWKKIVDFRKKYFENAAFR